MTATRPAPRLERQTFSTSRLAEFASRAGLTSATGFPPEDWPAYALKELVDNSIDDSEEHNTPPRIRVKIADDGIIVADRGSGLTGEIIERFLDYTQRTSAREAYVSPTRGAQGNALQTLLALPFALDGEQGQVTIEAHGEAYDIEFGIHSLTREPQVRRAIGTSLVRIGTQTTLHWPDSACSILTDAKPRFLPIVKAFAVLNPHSSIGVSVDGDDYVQFDPTDAEWRKWTPSAPSSAHWYDIERFERLIAAYVTHGKGERLIRDFLAEFAGLSGTARRKAVLDATGLARATLRSLCPEDRYDNATVLALLHAMQLHSRPVTPEALGVIGSDHWQVYAAAYCGDLDSFSYKRIAGESGGLPWMIEIAFCHAPDTETRTLVTGINFSPALRNPFQNLGSSYYPQSLDGLLSQQYAGHNAPVIIFVHFTSPRPAFTDRGKAGVILPRDCAAAFANAVTIVTKKWYTQREREVRDCNAVFRRREALARQRGSHMTIKDAAARVMADAFAKASGDGRLPAKARQIMYAARPVILAMTDKAMFDDAYFTQTLLPNYVEAHPEECANWDVVWDARGHFTEPHTGVTVPLGTIEVRGYLGDRPGFAGLRISVGGDQYPTAGPEHRFKNILFIEKEGFDQLLAAARIAERFDLAIMSTKGMSVTAARLLLDRLAERGVENVFVLHDFDVSGFTIAGTLATDSRRYRFKNLVRILDLGLRLDDVQAMALESEPVALKPREWAKRSETLRRHGATEAEIAFLRSRRVELNAATSPQFIAFLERKLAEHGVTKLIPDSAVLEQHWRRLYAQRRAVKAFAEIRDKCEAEAAAAAVPDDLAEQVTASLAEHPALAWDEVIRRAVP